jgi:hypothetical protein
MNLYRLDRFVRCKTVHLLTASCFASVVLLVSGCNRGEAMVTHAAGHEITAYIQGAHSIANREGSTILGSQFGAVTVERTRVRIEGQDWNAIPADVPVSIDIRPGKLRITAGRVRISRTVND